ncbi:hypothetical protein DI005_22340 [Prauserella sp. PE36]|uniref:hypothetical protein n=1 Tax=Prauserella sp. PE36 TaxID=1504709 RepID=UPI000DE406AF|nr:hypothetical protein [Prauserella sp. PE36]RBM17426.1 hypothetical protein DI005_22340 [Prauserella sp. PE36]
MNAFHGSAAGVAPRGCEKLGADERLASSLWHMHELEAALDAGGDGFEVGAFVRVGDWVTTREDGWYVFRSAARQPGAELVELMFNQAEVDAIYAAIHDHEFDASAYIHA